MSFLIISLEKIFAISEILDSEIEVEENFTRRKFSLIGNHSEISEILLLVMQQILTDQPYRRLEVQCPNVVCMSTPCIQK